MFQTEPIIFLQSLSSDFITFFMKAITQMGYEPFYAGVIGLIMFGVSFRKGFLILQLILWSAIVNSIFKDLFELPRPVYVDKNIQYLGQGIPNQTPYANMGAEGFFEPLNPEVVNGCRARIQAGAGSYGFPSGHVQVTTTLWGGMTILFKRAIISWVTPLMIILMVLSRMYLGRHFLADALGGALIGGVLIFFFILLAGRFSLRNRFFTWNSYTFSRKFRSGLFLFFLIVLPLCLLSFFPEKTGLLLGLNAGFLLVVFKGTPDDSGTFLQRVGRILLGGVIYLATSLIIEMGINLSGVDDDLVLVSFLSKALPMFLTIWGTVTICFGLGLYKKEKSVE